LKWADMEDGDTESVPMQSSLCYLLIFTAPQLVQASAPKMAFVSGEAPADAQPIESVRPMQSSPCESCCHLVAKLPRVRHAKLAKQAAKDLWGQLCPTCLVAVLMQPRFMVELSFHAVGCWLVQWALEKQDDFTAAQLASSLRGYVVAFATSPHANFVLRSIIKRLDKVPLELQFIVEEMWGEAFPLAQHWIGCRAFTQLVENAPHSARAIIDAMLESPEELITHEYGHYMVEVARDCGLHTQRETIVNALLSNMSMYAASPNGLFVIENTIDAKFKSKNLLREHREKVARALLALDLASIQKSPHGCRVVSAARKVLGA